MLDNYEKQEGEGTSSGLILCAEGGNEQIELLQLEQDRIKVAEYLTELSDQQLLKGKLHKEFELKRQLFSQKSNEEVYSIMHEGKSFIAFLKKAHRMMI